MTFVSYSVWTDQDKPEGAVDRVVLREEHSDGHRVLATYPGTHMDAARRHLALLERTFPKGTRS
jgi:hypothetical protein